MALFFPEEIKIGSSVFLSDQPYLKYTIGLDYTFKNRVYLEAQYVHGSLTERGRGNLSNFIMVTLERKFLNDDLTLSMTGGMSVKSWDKIEDTFGALFSPEASYRPFDNLELSLSLYLFDGKSGTLLGNLKDRNQIVFEIRRSF